MTMDDAVRISEDVEHFLRAVRAKELDRAVELLKAKPALLNTVEAGGYCALHFAAFNGDIRMLEMLLSHKPEVDLLNYDENSPLVMAVKGNQHEAIRLLVKSGADINKASSTGATAIHYAASMGFVDCMRLLASLGAATTFEPSVAGSLLHWACHSGDVNTVGTVLYDFAIPIDTADKHGGSALLTALFMKKSEVVQFLLEQGAKANIVIPEDGTTPLHIAVEHGDTECVKILCECGADVTVKNNAGESPMELAKRLNKEYALRAMNRSQTPAERRVEEAARFKDQGNKVFGLGENVKAAKFYTLAIHLDNTNHVYFSNRAACSFNQRQFMAAYWDALRCVTLKPDWPRGHLRRCVAELSLKKYEAAIATATTGLKLDPTNKDFANVKEEAQKKLNGH